MTLHRTPAARSRASLSFPPAPAPSRPAGRRACSTPARSAARTARRWARRGCGNAIELTRSAAGPGRLPARHRPRLRHRRRWRWRCGRCSAPRPVTMLAWESFGDGWVTDVVKQLKLDAEVRTRRLWRASRISPRIEPAGTSSSPGTAPPGRARARRRLDRRRSHGPHHLRRDSAAFAQATDWPKIDVGTFSWQKALGGEGGHGMLVLSPRAVERLESHAPAAAAAQDLPADQERQAERRHLQGRDDQHAVDARGRGLAVRARMGRACSAASPR